MAITTLRRLALASAIVASLAACQKPNTESVAPETGNAVTESSPSASSQAPVVWPDIQSEVKQDATIEARIDQIIETLTLEEKVGQMIQPEIRHLTPDDVRKYHVGSVLNGGGSFPSGDKYASVEDWLALADGFYLASIDKSNGRAGIPIMWGTDAVHGVGNVVGATLFPHNIALGAANNPELLKQIGWATARELLVTGIDWDFSPTVAVARNERWGRTYESWSEAPEIVGAYAGEMVRGLQGEAGEDFMGEGRVLATAKHFIGDGGTKDGIDRGDTVGDELHLRDVHGAGYFTALEAGVQAVMASFTRWDGKRMHGHDYLLNDVLKGQMNFDGLVVGDWAGHSFVQGCTATNCPQSVNAGLDVFMAPDADWKELYQNTVQNVKDGDITMARIDDAVRRILRVKLRAGLFEAGKPSSRPLAGKAELLGAPEHRAIARKAVQQSLVMLKNSDGLLPLSREAKVLVTGDGADNIGKQAGGWSISWQGTGNKNSDFPSGTSVFDGIESVVNAGGGEAILSEDGSFETKPDVAIVVFGEDPYAEMQGDVSNLAYKRGKTDDLELLQSFKDANIPVVALFITGRPLWVNRELNASDAFVVIWQPGTEGVGVSDVLFRNNDGDINVPMSGKLSFSWPKTPDQVPLNVGDENYDPLFPYGFGLTYADTDTLGDDLSEEGLTVSATSDVLPLFDRRPIEPWGIEAVGAENDRLVMEGKTMSTSTVTVTAVDRNEQEDARQVVFNGQGPGHVALFVDERQDWTGYVEDQAALIFDIKVDSAPTQTTYLRFGCGSYCASDLDMTEGMKEYLVGNGWQTLSVDLKCFPTSGENFGVQQPPEEFLTQVLRPFTIYTEGELDMSFANVRIEKNKAASALINCQNP
ncbi:glycoside hydrolase family 3 N-terminal domain-containing protein [Gilvimarinus sp. SDUM040013]|uniref:Glycoside hydrolase family 3 N-terminal domain-containing protein n=1 Tax=Gilvimarinus gilvus TaxID=3058038 RepID=A0ABU4S1R9_9GAMM|nr:glycoside hydrolase family 3 N-terminal domain-containing protein [Gilvimarinus sp. SDUM040013]MDO3387136.1 glycoside hydrolase family 3 N-terminal domain-containing protein [Gilvimarinus sp. SDUM040013]MDX6850879.1 glycoside hydrolase family 3 N-terminal domain-containing protein [Gilvimarinus sp. SDUM040013]